MASRKTVKAMADAILPRLADKNENRFAALAHAVMNEFRGNHSDFSIHEPHRKLHFTHIGQSVETLNDLCREIYNRTQAPESIELNYDVDETQRPKRQRDDLIAKRGRTVVANLVDKLAPSMLAQVQQARGTTMTEEARDAMTLKLMDLMAVYGLQSRKVFDSSNDAVIVRAKGGSKKVLGVSIAAVQVDSRIKRFAVIADKKKAERFALDRKGLAKLNKALGLKGEEAKTSAPEHPVRALNAAAKAKGFTLDN